MHLPHAASIPDCPRRGQFFLTPDARERQFRFSTAATRFPRVTGEAIRGGSWASAKQCRRGGAQIPGKAAPQRPRRRFDLPSRLRAV
ncbi:MAG: hypothetical protein Kow0045_11860 [Albidovulum sp.]